MFNGCVICTRNLHTDMRKERIMKSTLIQRGLIFLLGILKVKTSKVRSSAIHNRALNTIFKQVKCILVIVLSTSTLVDCKYYIHLTLIVDYGN